MPRKEIGRFVARDEAGRRHVIVEWRHTIDAGTLAAPGATKAGSRALTLADGRAVNRIDDDTFEIVAGGTTLSRQG